MKSETMKSKIEATCREKFHHEVIEDDYLTEDPLTEARARIIWGDSIAEIYDYLVSRGLSKEFAKSCVLSVARERVSIVRKHGIWLIVRGVLYIIAGLTYMYLIAALLVTYGGVITLKIFDIVAVFGIVSGLWLIFKGIGFVLTPDRRGDLSQLRSNADPMESLFDD